MAVIRKSDAPVFNLPGLTVLGLASPRRGASETCVWRVQVAPGTPGHSHRVTHEEVFVAVAGSAVATLGGEEHHLHAGDALLVPPNTDFSLANRSGEPFEAVVSFPVGGQAISGDRTFTPPWAE